MSKSGRNKALRGGKPIHPLSPHPVGEGKPSAAPYAAEAEIGAVVKEAGNSRKNKTGSWRTFSPGVAGRCTGCGICSWYCPEGAIRLTEKGGKKIVEIDYEYCKGCGICAEECPANAIKMKKE